MILTDKCKEDFLKYKNIQEKSTVILADIFLNALIIEWLDSVGIYVQISFDDLYTEEKIHIIFDAHVNKSWVATNCSSRQEATIKSIEMANDIYNDKYAKEKSEEFINNQKTK